MAFRLAKFCISLTAFTLLTFSSLAHALDVPPAPLGRVSDYAGLLSHSTKLELDRKLESFEKTDSTQIAVAIFPSLEGGSLEDFSMRLASAWKIGQKDHDNGVVFLIFKNDRQMRIEVGYGLEDKLTDATSSDIIRNVIVPEFKNGDFDVGVTRGVTAIMQAIQGAYTNSAPEASLGEAFAGLLLAIFFIALFFIQIANTVAGRGSILYQSSGWRGGGGGSFGGGFGGGGGSFGGGGASGRW
jgi:uncharacterized protein